MAAYLSPFSTSFVPHAHATAPEIDALAVTPWRTPAWSETEATGEVFTWSVTSFDETRMHVAPVPFEEPWETIGMHAAREGAELVMGIFPAHLQLHQRLNYALRASGLPLMQLPTAQVPAISAILAQLPIRGLIMPASDMPLLPRDLAGRDLYIQAVHGMDAKPELHAVSGCKIFNEVHLIPGIVAFFQCERLAAAGGGQFHLSDRFAWEISDRLRITDYRGRFARFELPHAFSVTDSPCACGRSVSLSYV